MKHPNTENVDGGEPNADKFNCSCVMVEDAAKIAIGVVYLPHSVVVDSSSRVGERMDHGCDCYVQDESLREKLVFLEENDDEEDRYTAHEGDEPHRSSQPS